MIGVAWQGSVLTWIEDKPNIKTHTDNRFKDALSDSTIIHFIDEDMDICIGC